MNAFLMFKCKSNELSLTKDRYVKQLFYDAHKL